MPTKRTVQEVFKEFLNIHWLRPEAAMFKTYDYSILKNITPFPQPSIDLCCGDGISSFIWAGGSFDLAFDMYQAVDNEQSMFQTSVDVFDSFDEEKIRPVVTRSPDWRFTVGLDLKETLIEKSKKLNFYERTVVHDLDDPMPFNEEFASAFSTTIWGNGSLERYENRVKNVHGILRPGGKFVFRMHDVRFRSQMVYRYYEEYGFTWAKRLDRSLYLNNPDKNIDINWWVDCLERNGFQVVKVHNYVPRLITMLYIIGFRPMFPSLIKMYRMLTDRQRIELKRQWLSDLDECLTELSLVENVQKVDPTGGNILYMVEAIKR